MTLDLIAMTPGDEARAWEGLKNTPVQHVLHNLLVRKILGLRDTLEKAEADSFATVKAEIAAHRFLLGLIHRPDPLPTK